MLDDRISESLVSDYAIFLAHPVTGERLDPGTFPSLSLKTDDADGGLEPIVGLDGALAIVPRRALSNGTVEFDMSMCCEDNAYDVWIVAPVPQGLDSVCLEVVPVLVNFGPLSSGRISNVIEDAGHYATSRASDSSQLPHLAVLAVGTVFLHV